MEEHPIYIILLATVAITVLLIFFVVSILLHHRRYRELQQARTRNEILVLEKERKRMAFDLHDNMGPRLAAVRMQLNSLEPELDEDRITIAMAAASIDEMMANIREISFDLLPSALQRKGFKEAVTELLHSSDTTAGLQTDLQIDQAIYLDPEQQLHLYRIVQEIWHNCLRHSKATRLRIRLVRDGQQHVLFLEDNGRGFRPEEVRKKSKGLGLLSIESRAQILNAQMLLETSVGNGCCYYFSFPAKQS